MGFGLVEVLEDGLGLDDVVHFALEVEVLVAANRLIILNPQSVQLKEFQYSVMRNVRVEFELDLTVQEIFCKLDGQLGLEDEGGHELNID